MNWLTANTPASVLMRSVLETEGATRTTMFLLPLSSLDLKQTLTANEPITSGVPSRVPSGEPLRQAGKFSKEKTGLSIPMTRNWTV